MNKGMKEYFIPYSGAEPAMIYINGHSLVIVSRDKDELQAHLPMLGGDHLQGMDFPEENHDEDEILEVLASELNGGGVVVAPDGTGIVEVIRSLELELPWIH